MQVLPNPIERLKTVAKDIADGFFEITHNSFALLGLAVVAVVVLFSARPDLRQSGEQQLVEWLSDRNIGSNVILTSFGTNPDASDRATATDPQDLPKQQAAVAHWLSKKYRVAPEPVSALVAEAFSIGAKAKIEPTLILAVMAIESGFNPFAQSHVGAQGLMQVMTKVHNEKYEDFGGTFAAFDPVSNLKVGVKILQECIARAGSVEGGLKYYVGAANMVGDGGYAEKVLAEQARLKLVAAGSRIDHFYNVPAPAQTARAGNPAEVIEISDTFLPAPSTDPHQTGVNL
jgi:Transglycosylase SLT domain